VLIEQTIENKKNLPHKRKKILLKSCGTICQHTTTQHSTAQMRNAMSFLWDLWLKGKMKDSQIHVKENDK
jgi:hypothetical protein